MSTVSTASNFVVDWKVFAGAIATFIVTVAAGWQGIRKGRQKVKSGGSEMTAIVGASIIETASVRDLTEALRANTTAVTLHTIALNRQTDVELIVTTLKKD